MIKWKRVQKLKYFQFCTFKAFPSGTMPIFRRFIGQGFEETCASSLAACPSSMRTRMARYGAPAHAGNAGILIGGHQRVLSDFNSNLGPSGFSLHDESFLFRTRMPIPRVALRHYLTPREEAMTAEMELCMEV
jgi:hypothetical protein